MESTYLQMLIDSLIKKQKILEELIVLNEEQSDIISEEEFSGEKFQLNIDKKDNLIDNLIRLDDGFESVFARVKDELDGNKHMYQKQITVMQQMIRTVTDLSVKVQKQEAVNKNSIQLRFASMKKDVREAKRSSTMANKYYKSMNKLSCEPQFMDKKKIKNIGYNGLIICDLIRYNI